MLPLQTGGSGLGEETNMASPVLYLPLLRGVVEFDVAGPGDLKPAKFVSWQSFSPEALSGSFCGKRDVDVHGFDL